ncbi:MAG: PTS sugar transporter subunit IIA [Planctomycetota bacterium]|nr:MAG: PTS sugar transporter subunit IIA [Planctomycetota bacterium]
MNSFLKLTEIFSPATITFTLPSEKPFKEDILRYLVHLLYQAGVLGDSMENALKAVLERERCMTTGIGNGFAIPHGKGMASKDIVGSLLIYPPGVDFAALDGELVQIIALLISNPQKPHLHLSTISRITKSFKDQKLREKLLKTTSSLEAYQIMEAYEKEE